VIPVTPPTDNLYKFMAIAGLLVAGFSLYFPITERRQYRDQVLALEIELAAQTAETQRINEALSRRDSLRPLTRQEEERFGRFDSLRAQRNATMPLRQEALARYRTDIGLFGVLLVLGTASGLGCAAAGFTLWYNRVQRHLDRALAADKGSAA
jgi:hypothetical protein